MTARIDAESKWFEGGRIVPRTNHRTGPGGRRPTGEARPTIDGRLRAASLFRTPTVPHRPRYNLRALVPGVFGNHRVS